jgi:hypothetical protein
MFIDLVRLIMPKFKALIILNLDFAQNPIGGVGFVNDRLIAGQKLIDLPGLVRLDLNFK